MTDNAPSANRRRELTWLFLWSLALFPAAMILNTRHNAFPFFFHPDEGGKVKQVITGQWNFHHPMLLLGATKVAVDTWHVERREQAVVEAGRWVSAAFTAASIGALALLAYMWRGWAASVAAGCALLVHHQLFELSHYMKEDTALLLGVALTLLMSLAFWQKPNRWRALLLGIAVALAISGKYVGAVVLLGALPVIWCAPNSARTPCVACFLAALVAALLVVNLPLVLNSASSGASLEREMNLVVHGQGEMTRRVPHSQYWNVFRDNSTPVIWLLLLVFLTQRWRERRSVSLAEWVIIAFPFFFALLLSFSPKSNDRYFLPATGVLTMLAALGVMDVAKLLKSWVPKTVTISVLACVLVLAQIPSWRTYENAFQRDDTAELIEWIRATLPASAVIAKDSRIRLPDSKNLVAADYFGTLPQKVLAEKFAADFGTVAEMRGKGITHVAVSESDYGKFFLKSLHPKKQEEQEFARRKAFYEELLRDNVPLFERERSTVIYLHPGIRVYRLPESP